MGAKVEPQRSKLFKDIIENDNRRSEMYARDVWPLQRLSDLNSISRRMTREAEVALSWNADKGKVN